MPFTLEVEFSGLCNYLIHPDGLQIGVVMPDGRQPTDGRPVAPDDFAASKQYLVYHTGYLRYNLADTGAPCTPTGRAGTPDFEVVHRFNGEELDFGLEFDEPLGDVVLAMPEVSAFAPNVEPRPGLFGSTPPTGLLMRTVLRGGAVSSRPGGGQWQFNTALNRGGTPVVGSFAGFATWRRHIAADSIVLRLKTWDGTVTNSIRLQPHGQETIVRLKVANLCAENALEWPELFLRNFDGAADNDFKWFYRLWRDTRGPFPMLLANGTGTPDRLPVPEPIPGHGDVVNCTGAKQTHNFLHH